MTVLDAYAVIALLREEPAAEQIESILASGPAALTAVGVAEVIDHLVRIVGADEEEAVLDLAQLGLLDAIGVDATTGSAAGRLRARRYHRTRSAVSMADCLAAEAARITDDALATSDPDLLDLCHAEGIAHLALPAVDGTVWNPPTHSPHHGN